MVLCIVNIIDRMSSAIAIIGGYCSSSCGSSASILSRSGMRSCCSLSARISTPSNVSNMFLNDQHIGIS